MVDVGQHEKIKLYAYSEVEEIKGYVGNYQIKIRRKAAYVDWTKCTGCGLCMEKCPTKNAYDYFNFGAAPTRAINIPFPQLFRKRQRLIRNIAVSLQKVNAASVPRFVPPAQSIMNSRMRLLPKK
jgi:heterodisulfide reductase subunit A